MPPLMVVPGADITFPRNTLRTFVEAAALARALKDAAEARPLPYWLRVCQAATFDVATIEWCILFGSDNAEKQKIHWKNMFNPEQFRSLLLKEMDISTEEWAEYQKGFVNYRNELAAHRDLNPVTRHYPNLDLALRAANFYHKNLCEYAKSKGVSMEDRTLLEHFELRSKEFRKDIQDAVQADRPS